MDIPTKYNPKAVEDKFYRSWQQQCLFDADRKPKKKPYSIVIPPPNVTGILHMGHALNNTLQDILIRYKRMQGFASLWMPGTDHAGIATQNVVEKELLKENLKRDDLGRDKFVQRVWKWKEKYGSTIINQLKKMGCSCDWRRTRFTMDEGYSQAVKKAFLHLHEKKIRGQGLIYRGYYIINWCPRCQTALSDEESPHKEVKGFLYYIKYPIKDSKSHIMVATTRPETMLGDVAVAVNPKDKRYKHLIGKTLILPLMNREIEVIEDPIVDMKFGTGMVKVTPAHDPNDFSMAMRHKLVPVLVMNSDGTMNTNAGEFANMDRFEAREAIVEALKQQHLLKKVEAHLHAVGHCYRCNTMIEPYLSEQWFVNMKPLAKPAIDVVTKGEVKFYPARWKKVYLNWMHNIQDWCISRQIWWGHRIPAWYCRNCYKEYRERRLKEPLKLDWTIDEDEAGIIVSEKKPKSCWRCGSEDLYQDPDVLDTWFSSWLWPFATFGWPFHLGGKDVKLEADSSKLKAQKEDLKYFYPTSVLITAQEIIFFWVARMVMAGMEFVDKKPFSDVYIHGTVRDATGKKMSKSLGNIIDPLEIIEQFGADALRFSLVMLTAGGQDVFLSREKFELGRNFANKIWNASRFILMNLDKKKVKKEISLKNITELKERWILSRSHNLIKKTDQALEGYRFNEASKLIYEFFWHEFCDWYIELSKETLDEAQTQTVLHYVLSNVLKVLHPFMPFITEEIWQKVKLPQAASISVSPWPEFSKQFVSKTVDDQMQEIIELITAVRNIRAQWHIRPNDLVDIYVKVSAAFKKPISAHADFIKRLARVDKINIEQKLKRPPKSAVAVIKNMDIYVPLAKLISIEKEKQRLQKEQAEVEKILQGVEARLKNKAFLKNAPPDIITRQKEKKQELTSLLKRINLNLKSIK